MPLTHTNSLRLQHTAGPILTELHCTLRIDSARGYSLAQLVCGWGARAERACLYRGHRVQMLVPSPTSHRRSLDGSWTPNLPHDPSDACGTADAPRVATGHGHP